MLNTFSEHLKELTPGGMYRHGMCITFTLVEAGQKDVKKKKKKKKLSEKKVNKKFRRIFISESALATIFYGGEETRLK